MESLIDPTFYLAAGTGRTYVPIPFMFAMFSIPAGILGLMLPIQKIPSLAKQILSIPLLAIIFATPILFSPNNGGKSNTIIIKSLDH